MKKLLFFLLVVGGLSYGGLLAWKKLELQTSKKPASRTTTATVEPRDIRFAITVGGDIGPAEQVSVRPEINGRIDELPVDIGDQVKKGQLLFRLDDQDLQTERASRMTEIERARLQIENARLQQDNSERNFKRVQTLYQDKLVPEESFEEAKTNYELAKVAVGLARNALEKAEKELRVVEDKISKTKIIAPFDCTVLTRSFSVGQAVSGSGGYNSGTEVLTVANLSDMIINAHINQVDVTRIFPGQQVIVQVESVQGLDMKGQIERIAPQATFKNNIKGFAARIQIKNIDPRVRPGMTAMVRIPVVSAENVLAVPIAAVYTEPGDSEKFVLVKKSPDSTEFERKNVRIGISDFDYAEVLSGLAAGEIVAIVPPAEFEQLKLQSGKEGEKGSRPPRPNSRRSTATIKP